MNRPRALLPPNADPGCPTCRGVGHVVRRGAEYAVAEACACLRPCPLCRGTGWIAAGEGPRAPRKRCRCQVLPERLRRFNDAGIPARHATSTRSTFLPTRDNKEAFKAVNAWLTDFEPNRENRGLVLWGDVGRGKTHLLVAMVRDLVIDHGVTARFTEFSHLLAAIKAGFDRGEGMSASIDPLVRVDVLAIDEIGKGLNTDFERAVIDELISRRYNAAKPIVGTTNFAPGPATGVVTANAADPSRGPALADRVDVRVYSRLREMCDFARVQGEDWRERRWGERR